MNRREGTRCGRMVVEALNFIYAYSLCVSYCYLSHARCFAVPFSRARAAWSAASLTEGEGRDERGLEGMRRDEKGQEGIGRGVLRIS